MYLTPVFNNQCNPLTCSWQSYECKPRNVAMEHWQTNLYATDLCLEYKVCSWLVCEPNLTLQKCIESQMTQKSHKRRCRRWNKSNKRSTWTQARSYKPAGKLKKTNYDWREQRKHNWADCPIASTAAQVTCYAKNPVPPLVAHRTHHAAKQTILQKYVCQPGKFTQQTLATNIDNHL